MKRSMGFTLVELLAVIVVLAIIMVIATQQVNTTVKKARTESFVKSLDIAVKSAKNILAQENTLDDTKLKDTIDYSSEDYDYKVDKVVDNLNSEKYLITINAKSSSKFSSSDFSLISKNNNYVYENLGLPKICTYIDNDGNMSKPDSCTSIGDKICFDRKNKKDCFYVLDVKDNKFIFITEYNLNTSGEQTLPGKSGFKIYFLSSSLYWNKESSCHTVFNEDKVDISFKTTFSKYKTNLRTRYNIDVDDITLINKDLLEKMKSDNNDCENRNFKYYYKIKDEYKFIYNGNNPFWTGVADPDNKILTFAGVNNLVQCLISIDGTKVNNQYGIRPVIVISKSELENLK